MSVYSHTLLQKRGMGKSHFAEQTEIISRLFCGKGNRFFVQNRDENFSRRGRRLCPITQRSGVVCFDEPFAVCQNRYWVNTIYTDMHAAFHRLFDQSSIQH